MFTWFKNISGLTYQLNEDDIVVFLLGPSEGGKSWFIQEVTKSSLITPYQQLQPSATGPVAIRCTLTDEAKVALNATIENNIVFVDVPSFHTFTSGSDRARIETGRWLKNSKSKSTCLGIIYVDRVETNPANGSIQDRLDAFASTFPKGFKRQPKRLRMLLTYESNLTDRKIQTHREAFQAQLVALKSSITGDGIFIWDSALHSELFIKGHHVVEIAWNAVQQLFYFHERPDDGYRSNNTAVNKTIQELESELAKSYDEQSRELARLKDLHETQSRELSSVRDQLHTSQSRNEEKDRTIAALTIELDYWKHSDTMKEEEVAAVRNELKTSQERYFEQIRDLKSVVADSQPTPFAVHHFITESDAYAEKMIVGTLERLNTDIHFNSMIMAGRIIRNLKSIDEDEESSAMQRAAKSIGQTLVDCLQKGSRDALAVYLPIAFRAYLTTHLCDIISSWMADKGYNTLLSKTYERLQESESQASTARWRSLTRAYASSSLTSDPDAFVSATIQGLSDIVVTASCASSVSAAQSMILSSFRYRISSIISTAGLLSMLIGNTLSADFKLVALYPNERIDETAMGVDLGDGSGKRGAVMGRWQKVLCTTELGLRKEVVEKSPDRRKKNTLATTTMVKGKVVLELPQHKMG